MFTIDIIIVVILCVFFVIGFTRGLIKQFGSIVGYFVAMWAASHYYMPVAEYIKKGLSGWQPFLAGPLSILVGFLGAYIIAYFLWHLLINFIDGMFRLFSIVPFLNMTNRLGGAAIGLVEGILILSAVTYVMLTFPLSQEWIAQAKESRVVPIFKEVANFVKPFLPQLTSGASSLLNTPAPFALQNFDVSKIDINTLDLAQVRAYMKQLNISEKDLPPEIQKMLEAASKTAPQKTAPTK